LQVVRVDLLDRGQGLLGLFGLVGSAVELVQREVPLHRVLFLLQQRFGALHPLFGGQLLLDAHPQGLQRLIVGVGLDRLLDALAGAVALVGGQVEAHQRLQHAPVAGVRLVERFEHGDGFVGAADLSEQPGVLEGQASGIAFLDVWFDHGDGVAAGLIERFPAVGRAHHRLGLQRQGVGMARGGLQDPLDQRHGLLGFAGLEPERRELQVGRRLTAPLAGFQQLREALCGGAVLTEPAQRRRQRPQQPRVGLIEHGGGLLQLLHRQAVLALGQGELALGQQGQRRVGAGVVPQRRGIPAGLVHRGVGRLAGALLGQRDV